MEYRHALPPEHILASEFKILSVLGTGGFAFTYKALDLSLNTEVAIKEYFPGQWAYRDGVSTVRSQNEAIHHNYQSGLDRFIVEARTLAQFRHVNIVRINRVFSENNTAYLVMEFVAGADMEHWLSDLGHRPSQDELDTLTMPLLRALKLVHQNKILHRDIKPENVYIRKEDGQPVLLDFGAARAAAAQNTKTIAIVSHGFSPFESYHTDASEQGPWTDIYGLAATLHRAIVGKPPPEANTRVPTDGYQPLLENEGLRARYRSDFLRGIDWGLRLFRQDRPQSIDAWSGLLRAPGLAPSEIAVAPAVATQPVRVSTRPPASPTARVSSKPPRPVTAKPPKARQSSRPPTQVRVPAGRFLMVAGIAALALAAGIGGLMFGPALTVSIMSPGAQAIQAPSNSPAATASTASTAGANGSGSNAVTSAAPDAVVVPNSKVADARPIEASAALAKHAAPVQTQKYASPGEGAGATPSVTQRDTAIITLGPAAEGRLQSQTFSNERADHSSPGPSLPSTPGAEPKSTATSASAQKPAMASISPAPKAESKVLGNPGRPAKWLLGLAEDDHTGSGALVGSTHGGVLAVGTTEGAVALWDPVAGTRRFQLAANLGRVTALGLGADGQVAVGGETGVRILAGADGADLNRLDLGGRVNRIWGLAFDDPGGKLYIVGDKQRLDDQGNMTHVTELLSAGQGQAASIDEHEIAMGAAIATAFSTGGRVLVAATFIDRTITIWDARAGTLFDRIAVSGRPPRALAFYRDEWLVAGGQNGTLQIWNLGHPSTSRATGGGKQAAGAPAVLAVAVSPDGRYIAAINADSMLSIVQVDTGATIWQGKTDDQTGAGGASLAALAGLPKLAFLPLSTGAMIAWTARTGRVHLMVLEDCESNGCSVVSGPNETGHG